MSVAKRSSAKPMVVGFLASKENPAGEVPAGFSNSEY
jgi:hypothetical protein